MKKSTTLFLLSFLFVFTVFAQQQRNCKSMENLEYRKQLNPNLEQNMQDIETYTKNKLQEMQSQQNKIVGDIITIPVVVHVIYSNANENISNAQIMSQMQVLNDDFRRTNADADNTWSQAGDSQIEFCLAAVDENGNPTNGITRKSSTRTSWGTNDAMKKSSQGGVDPWDTSQYLNMWVCNIGGGILGYAQFPGGSAATDGVVMSPNYFGSKNGGSGFYLSAPFDLGRTTTHEVGHFLNLRHIWGDGGCGVDDFVSDTPTSDAPNYGCTPSHSSCGSTDMVQNYMDYSDDACMNLYTQGQIDRMRVTLLPGGVRASLGASTKCDSGSTPTCDDGIQNGDETGVDCGGSCEPCNTPPTCDDGIQNGDETGVDCGGSSCEPCSTACTDNEVNVTITLDNYPEETAWSIVNASGTTVASGSYSSANPDGSTVSETLCLPDGCYDFIITDSYGDGICCAYGNGSYSVTNASGTLASGGSFNSSETTNFCVGAQPACTDVTVSIKLDNYPEETSWELKNASGTTVASANYTSANPDGSTVEQTICLPDGCYDFVINDSYGDGICCSYGVGSYTVSDGSGTLASGGSFGRSETTNFCIGNSRTAGNLRTIDVNNNDFVMYPNPVKGDLLNIKIKGDLEGTYRILNITGQTIAKGRLTKAINVSALEQGVYFIEINDGIATMNKKFIKQ
ncbi:M43 family zinc metalloprotease [Pontimicrobium sp. MEBiC01747]